MLKEVSLHMEAREKKTKIMDLTKTINFMIEKENISNYVQMTKHLESIQK